ncbi:MAG TPA: R2-like ligand-binding oxidase [Gemmatimonadales bacterium]|nr:R2-like ligand-binding oxidase [Gemmatimonadales bacterium]
MTSPLHQRFTTTSPAGLRHDSVPMRLYREARRLGGWDPQTIDFQEDARDWARLGPAERDLLLRLTALFQAGEEGMTFDLVPLLVAVGRERRLEDELFLTTVLADEAKHTEFFRRFLDEVCRWEQDLHAYHTPSFRRLFYEELPRAMGRLLDDPSPEAQAEALVTYTLIGEGVLSETGHHLYAETLRRHRLMPGLLQGLVSVQRDEARHLEYGVFALTRLVAAAPEAGAAADRRMDALLPEALGVVNEFFTAYDPVPFGLSVDGFASFALARFAARTARLEEARALGPAAAAPDPAIAAVRAWVEGEVRPAVVRVTFEATSGVYVFAAGRADGGDAALLVSREVLARHSPPDVIAALEAARAGARLRTERGLRLFCVLAGGRIVVQPPG